MSFRRDAGATPEQLRALLRVEKPLGVDRDGFFEEIRGSIAGHTWGDPRGVWTLLAAYRDTRLYMTLKARGIQLEHLDFHSGRATNPDGKVVPPGYHVDQQPPLVARKTREWLCGTDVGVEEVLGLIEHRWSLKLKPSKSLL